MTGATVYDFCWKCRGEGARHRYTVPLRGDERCENCGAPRHENAQPGSAAASGREQQP